MKRCENNCKDQKTNALAVYRSVDYEGESLECFLCEECGKSIGLSIEHRFYPVYYGDLPELLRKLKGYEGETYG